MKKMKIGLDVHGVIDTDPSFFADFTSCLKNEGHEIHVLTGRENGPYINDKLRRFDIVYDHLFSITSYHKEIGTHITYENGDPTQPMMNMYKWDITKSIYAKQVGLDIHIDDSKLYGRYFVGKTEYILYSPGIKTLLSIFIYK